MSLSETKVPQLKAVVLVDNIGHQGLTGEWGLSIYIKYGDRRLLLDTGASGLFLKNARKMKLPMKKIDCAVLSHAHYDHADGMKTFFACNDHAGFYVRKETAENCYAKKWIFHKYIGIPRHVLQEYSQRIYYVEGDYKLYSGVWLIPHKTPGLEQIGRREKMDLRTENGWRPDNFAHEQSLVFETERGLVIFNSCSHGGAANIINEVAATFPDKKVYGLIGGFHLFNKTEGEIRALAEEIRKTGIAYVCTGHCTGERAYEIMKKELGENLHQLHVGLMMKF